MGRPRKDIDGVQVRRLAALGCTQQDVAEYFGVDQSTISHRFSSDFALGNADGKYSLRRMQWKAAASGSEKMLIHLGKVYLGQSDRVDITSKGESVALTVIELPIKELHADRSAQPGAADSLPGLDG